MLIIIISVEDVTTLLGQLGDTVRVIQPLRKMPYGREFYIADPDGNVVAIMSAEGSTYLTPEPV